MADGAPTGLGYALAMLQRAWAALTSAGDDAARGRGEGRVAAWEAVLAGMADGSLDIGSRQAVVGVPVWVTPEVVHGGFATTRLLAERPLDAAEAALVAALDPSAAGGTPRGRLSRWWLSPAGMPRLLERLDAGTYRVDVPEQAALGVVAWLVRAGQVPAAAVVVAELEPWFDRLALSPALVDAPEPRVRGVRRVTADVVAAALRGASARRAVVAMRASLAALPVVDQAVALWCETVEGPLPRLVDGRVEGGWPGARWPDGWAARGAAVLAAHDALVGLGRHAHRRSNHQALIGALRVVLAAPSGGQAVAARTEDGPVGGFAAMDRRALGRVRRALANDLTARGAPGSPGREALRAAQAATLALPTFPAVRRVVARRLDTVGPERGLVDPDALAAPVAPEEAEAEAPAGSVVPAAVRAKLELAREAPLAELVERGVVGSAEVLAALLPQVSAAALWSGLADATLAGLLERTYRAFRARRSLLLTNYQHQVRFAELPWVAAVSGAAGGGGRASSADALREVAALALRSFPGSPTPDLLVRELSALAEAAGVPLELTEGLAADIFQGGFTPKWARAAGAAARRLEGTLYARYYDLPAWSGEDPTPAAFAVLCRARAREAGVVDGGGGVAVNGAIVEASEVLTTRNLVALVDVIGPDGLGDPAPLAAAALREALAGLAARRRSQERAAEKARRAAWAWQQVYAATVANLAAQAAVRQAAGAWRQGVFFLSLCDAPEAVIAGLPAADADAARVVEGLRQVAAGGRFGPDGVVGDGRRLLGWSVGPHWLG